MTVNFRHPLIPPDAPLEMPTQDLGRPFHDPSARPVHSSTVTILVRCLVFAFALATTGWLGFVFADWFKGGMLSWPEAVMIGLVMFTFFWISLSVAISFLGLFYRDRPAQGTRRPLTMAILLPVYGEPVEKLTSNLESMLRDLSQTRHAHQIALFVLSDTRDAAKVEAERAMIARLRAAMPTEAIHYRHRPQNADFKTGNIRDWVTRHGADYEAMLVLDADSQMSAEAMLRLADAMSEDPGAGLIQTIPRLIGSRTFFARMQQFSNLVSGSTLGRGLAIMSGTEANFWGHNAIIRTRAFAASAGLPRLKGRKPFGGVIMSHDFVEAALIRRAGWTVNFLPEAIESFEETPATIIEFVQRDRRWCQGNIQHLRLLTTRGLTWMNRFHMFQGAMAYIASVAWFALLVLWALLGVGSDALSIVYFTDAAPMFPKWPEMDIVSKVIVLGFVYGMLVAPKLIGALRLIKSDPGLAGFGGWGWFSTGFLTELGFSIAMAPMMMVQHMLAVGRALIGRDTGWAPKRQSRTSLSGLLRFHAVETMLGLLLTVGCVTGTVSLWIAPIAGCLLLAVPLSALGSLDMSGWRLLTTPQDGIATGSPTVGLATRKTPRTV